MITNEQIDSFIKANVQELHSAAAYFLESVNLPELLRGENPYLLMRPGCGSVDGVIRQLLNRHLNRLESREVGDVLESLAHECVAITYGGWKSERKGISFEFVNGSSWYIAALIAFPNYDEGNEILEVEDCLSAAAWNIKRENPSADVIPVVSCTFGRESLIEREDYLKYCGQDFWELISGDAELYTRIVDPLKQASAIRSPSVAEAYARAVNRLSLEFYRRFCNGFGAIVWEKLVSFSGRAPESQTA